MYIPKKNRFGTLLKRKSSTSSINNWSGICTEFIKDMVFRRRSTVAAIQDDHQESNHHNPDFLNDPKLCLDQLSEFQKSYVSFPEFNDSTISDESDADSCNTPTNNSNIGHYWGLSTSSSSSL